MLVGQLIRPNEAPENFLDYLQPSLIHRCGLKATDEILKQLDLGHTKNGTLMFWNDDPSEPLIGWLA